MDPIMVHNSFEFLILTFLVAVNSESVISTGFSSPTSCVAVEGKCGSWLSVAGSCTLSGLAQCLMLYIVQYNRYILGAEKHPVLQILSCPAEKSFMDELHSILPIDEIILTHLF